jgi:diguanylate cyclase (GGDEF)-like protein/PAS domain S-box-containing protein
MLAEIALGTAALLAGAGAVLAGTALVLVLRRRAAQPSGTAESAGTAETLFDPDFRTLLEVMQLGVTVTDASGIIIYTNPADAAMHGYTPSELIGRPASIFAPPTTRKTVITGEVNSLRRWRREVYNLRKDGEIFPVRLRSDLIRDAEGQPLGMVTTCEDITDEMRLRDAQATGSLNDALTGLGNRPFFLELVVRAKRRADRHGDYHYAVLCLDLERFKLINESLGHDAGDGLLKQVADRLKDAIRPNDVAARTAGDEFVVLLDALRQPEDATIVAERIIAAMDAPFSVRGQEVYISPNIGIVHGAAEPNDAEQHLKDAREAMYSARSAGRNLYGVFEKTTRRRVTQRLQLETDLRKAIDEEELRAVYQPIVDLQTARTVGFEALIRWMHRERGMISPGDFIPAAEDTGLVVPMGWWMVQTACGQLGEWQRALPDLHVTMNVNLSVRQLRQPRLTERILEILEAAGLSPQRLKLEVTESMLMDEPDAQIAVLHRLRSAGMGVVIDDFGTGYSSLGYLQRFEFDVLKIDRSFLPIAEGDEGWDIVRMIMGLAQDQGAAVVAEGVEYEHQVNTLRELGCPLAQGFWFARPLDLEAATARLRQEQEQPTV